jgi:hypothetical protein
MQEPEIKKMWALSTAHLRDSTCNRWLGNAFRSRLPVAYDKGEFGWFVHVPDDHPADIPNELIIIFSIARGMGVDWIEFDCDAPVFDELVIYDW